MSGRSDYSSNTYREDRKQSGRREEEYGSSYRSDKSHYGSKDGNERSNFAESRRDLERPKEYGRRDRSEEGRKEYGRRDQSGEGRKEYGNRSEEGRKEYGNRQFGTRPYRGNQYGNNKKFGYSGRNHFVANQQSYKKQYERKDRESTYPPPGWMERPSNSKHNNNSYDRKPERTDAYGKRVEYGRQENYGRRAEYGRIGDDRSEKRHEHGRMEKKEERKRGTSTSSDRSSSSSDSSRKRRSVRDIVDDIVEKRLRNEAMTTMEPLVKLTFVEDVPISYIPTVPKNTVTLTFIEDDTVPVSYGPTVPEDTVTSEKSAAESCSSSSSSSSGDSDDEIELDHAQMHTSSDGSPLYDDDEVERPSEVTSTMTEMSKWEQE